MYISCTEPSCHNGLPDFQLVRRNSFTTAYPMNCQHKLVWQLGSVHKIHIHLEATSPFNLFLNLQSMFLKVQMKWMLIHLPCLDLVTYLLADLSVRIMLLNPVSFFHGFRACFKNLKSSRRLILKYCFLRRVTVVVGAAPVPRGLGF